MSRLLFITTNFENGAIPNILLDLAPHWKAQGWDCHFLALEPLPEDHASVQRCRALGFPLESLNVSSRSVLRAMARLGKAIRRLQPDLISTHLGRADIYTPWVKGRVPMVSTHHNILAHHGRLTRWGYQVSDHLVAARSGVSEACNASFVATGFLKAPHHVITNPVDPARMVPHRSREDVRQDWGWPGDSKVILTVARLSEQKGYPVLLEALGRLVDQGHSDLRLVVAGTGPLRSELERICLQRGIADRVRFLGMVTDVSSLYAAADLFVLPSLWEGLGLVLVEAWLGGLPVVATRLPAIEEFLESGVQGLLVAPNDARELAQAISQALKAPAEAQAWAQAGAELARRRFSPRTIAAQYDALFRDVLTSVRP